MSKEAELTKEEIEAKAYLKARFDEALAPYVDKPINEALTEAMRNALVEAVSQLEEEEIILPPPVEGVEIEVVKAGENSDRILRTFHGITVKVVCEHKVEDETPEKNQKKEEMK